MVRIIFLLSAFMVLASGAAYSYAIDNSNPPAQEPPAGDPPPQPDTPATPPAE